MQSYLFDSFDDKNLAHSHMPPHHANLKYVNGIKMKENSSNKLNQYFTKELVARDLIDKAQKIISSYENLEKYTYIEPSVGEGSFYKFLPESKIGIDIEPCDIKNSIKIDKKRWRENTEGYEKINRIIKCNYLHFQLPSDKPLIVIGNPPFGHRGVLALEFIHHSKNADFVCFILPMFFQSLGKGSIRYRVKGFHLLYEEALPQGSFYTPNGKDADVKACFQIWSKNHRSNINEFSWYKNTKNEPFYELLKVVTVSLAKNRECGKEWIFEKRADFYLSSTFFKSVKVEDSFEKVNYKSGLGIILTAKNDALREKLRSVLESANWLNYCSTATNGCKHIGKSHVFKLLQDNGF